MTNGHLTRSRFLAGEIGVFRCWPVHLSHVIEHVPDPFLLLDECRRILNAGRVLHLPDAECVKLGTPASGKSWQCLDMPRHMNLFTVPALRRAAEQAGFRIVRLETTVHTAWVLGRWAIAFGKMAAPNGRNCPSRSIC